MRNSITDVPGVKVGHWTDREARTGCTVVLLPPGCRAGACISGSAPASRDTPVLAPGSWVPDIQAILFCGGSAFGLDAAGGVMRWLASRGIGHPTRFGPVPIVPAACIYDLNVGDPCARPGLAEGESACEAAGEDFERGAVGAGAGATCGKWCGIERAVPGGIGTACRTSSGGLVVGALAVVSPIGDVIGDDGALIAGVGGDPLAIVRPGVPNTVLVAVATTARLDRAACHIAAMRIPDGIARAVRPAHTLHDGDIGFFVSAGEAEADIDLVMQLAARTTSEAIRNAVGA